MLTRMLNKLRFIYLPIPKSDDKKITILPAFKTYIVHRACLATATNKLRIDHINEMSVAMLCIYMAYGGLCIVCSESFCMQSDVHH